MKILIVALYQFTRLENYEEMREPLQEFCKEREIRGTLILALEGINGTVAGPEPAMRELIAKLHEDERFADLEWKESWSHDQPFLRMKVKLKREIVTIGRDDIDPTACVGKYVEPEEWNQLIQDPDVVLIDTRNDYETMLGTFKGAVDPDLNHFRQFPDYVQDNLNPQRHKKVAMFCTGGIRCEKASSYLLKQGFEEVYHLKGGILKYLEKIPKEQSLWEGECFVFDGRVSVDHDLNQGQYGLCPNCRMPLSEEDMESPKYEHSISCPYCYDSLTEERRERLLERKHQIEIAKARGEEHMGISTEEKRELKKKKKEELDRRARENLTVKS